MKAIQVSQFGGPEVLKLEDLPLPTINDNEVLVRVKAVGVNPVEAYIRTGTYAASPKLPYTPGSDAAGIIEAVGSKITKWKVGQRVYSTANVAGAYAQFIKASENAIYPLPDNASFEQGASIAVPYATAFHALYQRGQAKPGDYVLIHGATGGVGVAAVQFGLATGLKVIASYGTEKGKELLEKFGVTLLVNHREPDHLKKVKELTQGHGVDVIVEMLANENLGKDLEVLAFQGRVCIVGSRGPCEINPRDIMMKRAAINGVALRTSTESEVQEQHEAIVAGLTDGTLSPVIGTCYPLADASKAHQEIINPPSGGTFGKLILLP